MMQGETNCYRQKPFPFRATVCKTVRNKLSDHLSCLSVTLVYCGQTARWIKMKLGTEVALDPGHIVLDGDQAPLQKKIHIPNFRPMSVVAKRLDVFKTPLGTEVGLGPGHIALDRDPARQLRPHRKGHSSPVLFGRCLLWPNGRPSQQLLSSCLSFMINISVYKTFIQTQTLSH